MRHEAHHVPALVDDARNVMNRAVHGLVVAEADLTSRLELVVQILVGEPAALAVLHRDDELLVLGASCGERGVRALDAEANVATDERQRFVRSKDAREESCLAEDLEAVTDPEHEPAGVRECCDGRHRRRETRDRATAEVVAVREPTGKNDGAELGKLRGRMPDGNRLGVECRKRPERVAIVVRPWKLDDADSRAGQRHVPFSRKTISYDSINGFARSCSHIRSSVARAPARSESSISTSITRPMRA